MIIHTIMICMIMGMANDTVIVVDDGNKQCTVIGTTTVVVWNAHLVFAAGLRCA